MQGRNIWTSLLMSLAVMGCAPQQGLIHSSGSARLSQPPSSPETDTREIWPGENGHIRFQLSDAVTGHRIGFLAVLSQDANQTGISQAAPVQPPLSVGDERWTWFQASWPTGGWTMSMNMGEIWEPPAGTTATLASRVSHSLFSGTAAQVPSVPQGGNQRLYKLSFNPNGSSPVAWLWVELNAQGQAMAIHWYKSVNVQQSLLRVDESASLYATPIEPSALPSTAYVINQQTL